MALQSPKHPEWDEDYLKAAIVHYYMERKHSMRKIGKALKLSLTQVRRVLLASPDCRIRKTASGTTEIVRGVQYRRCKYCGEEMELNDQNFHRDKSMAGGFKYTCKECRKDTG